MLVLFLLLGLITHQRNVNTEASNVEGELVSGDVSDGIFDNDFVTLSHLRHTDSRYLHIAIIITNGKKESEQLMTKMSYNLQKMFASILKFNKRTPLHFIVISDEDTRPLFKSMLQQSIGKFLSEKVIRHNLNLHFPKMKVEFTRLTSITNKYREEIDRMKKLFGFSDPDLKYIIKDEVVLIPNTKYTHDLFFIAPFYHKEVTEAIHKLIVIDIDLEFRIDLLDLYRHFSFFKKSEMVGLAPDLSPHYHQMSSQYREDHPDTVIGSPGKYQVQCLFEHSFK